ncbi:alpha/beta hydrolase family protein [Asanoa siamensis]|uniref:alpha/beta hydrolase family protein n=1 Tax=Asanoa siamensis TaxID=926357 RepID=UPI001940BCBD|nr:prolyl oligopeptidase family serine peptidase [Asanoa siamensis]
MASHTVFSKGFFRDKGMDYRARVVLGRAAHGGSDVGEVLATLDQISDQESWRTAWSATADRVRRLGDAFRERGDERSAGSAFLRAANYWACVVESLSELDDDAAIRLAFRAHRDCWDAFVDCAGGAHVRVGVPYEDQTLPGYLLRPDASGTRRPTLVITNGSDGAISGLWSSAAAGAVARGWNAFVYDGPGQQSMLFDRQTSFRPDWEAVLTPVIDTLVARDDVDQDKLTGYGISQGGYWLVRALAAEHRLVAAVADPGVVDVSTSWTAPLSSGMRKALDKGDRAAFDRDMKLATMLPSLRRTLAFRSRPYEAEADWFGLYAEIRAYQLTDDLAAKVTTPVFVTDPEDEQFWPGQSRRLATMLGDRAHVAAFTAEEGANMHCQPLARTLTDDRMFAWLNEQLGTVH